MKTCLHFLFFSLAILMSCIAPSHAALYTSNYGTQLTSVSDTDDTPSSQINFSGAGQSINFFGSVYSGVVVSPNGYVSFGVSSTGRDPSSIDVQTIAPMIAGLLTDLISINDAASNVYINTSTPGELIVTWENMGRFVTNSPPDYTVRSTFQLVIRSSQFLVPLGQGQIGFFYGSITNPSIAAAGFGDGLSTRNSGEVSFHNGPANALSNRGPSWFNLNSGPPTQGPICALTATPASIPQGGRSTLTASCNQIPTSYSWSGGNCPGTNGPTCVVTPFATTTYSVIGNNASGAGNTASATVTVGAPTIFCTLTASPATVNPGGTSTLTTSCNTPASTFSWTGGTCAGTNAATCVVTPSATTTYGVTGSNGITVNTASATVTVNPPGGASLRTIGSRGTVTSTSTLFGGFTLATSSNVMIAVRGTSLQSLGISQNPLNNPGLRLFDASGRDLLTNTSGGSQVSSCPSSSTTAIYYATVRSLALDPRDSCAESRLPAGVYTFTITPGAGSTDLDGEVLFEVTLDQPVGAFLNTIGSRGTVTSASTLFGGFTLGNSSNVMIAVRGTSLQSLGITQNPLNNPGLRLFDAGGRDLLTSTSGGAEIGACSPANSTAIHYATVRGLALDSRDACIETRFLPAGVYSFSITPSIGSTDRDGEVLFEVTLNP